MQRVFFLSRRSAGTALRPALRRVGLPVAVPSALLARTCSTLGPPPPPPPSATPSAAAPAVPPTVPAPEADPSASASPAAAAEADLHQLQALAATLAKLPQADRDLILNALRNPNSQKPSVMGGPGIGTKGADMVAAFTCGRCDFRMVKKFSKHAYTKGIVIVECPGCQAKHLLADNLGWLEDKKMNVEDYLREKGERFTRLGGGDYQVEPPLEAAEGAAPAATPAAAAEEKK